MMNTREGIIPSVLSSVVTTTGVLFRKNIGFPTLDWGHWIRVSSCRTRRN